MPANKDFDNPHAMTVRTDADPYGCKPVLRAWVQGLMAFEVDELGARPYTQTWPHRMSTACRYDRWRDDPRCQTCGRAIDVEYLRQMGIE
jgi:hypothetical protein